MSTLAIIAIVIGGIIGLLVLGALGLVMFLAWMAELASTPPLIDSRKRRIIRASTSR